MGVGTEGGMSGAGAGAGASLSAGGVAGAAQQPAKRVTRSTVVAPQKKEDVDDFFKSLLAGKK